MKSSRLIRTMLGTFAITLIAQTGFAQRIPFSGNRFDTAPILSEEGFLFVDGQYLAPPYKIELNEDEISINGRAFTADAFDLSSGHDRGNWNRSGASFGRRGGGPRPAEGGWSSGNRGNRNSPGSTTPANRQADNERAGSAANAFALRQFHQQFDLLHQGVLMILRSGAKPMRLGSMDDSHTLLKQLVALSERPTSVAEIPYTVYGMEDRETWRLLVEQFQPTAVFVERASQHIDEYTQAVNQIDAQVASVQWNESISYPLTMVALILVVVGLGHLMASAHTIFSVAIDRQETSELSKNVVWLLVIMASMSMIDLVWTVMAHSAGSMRELNPLGSKLIDDTSQLIAFKLIVTGVSISLFFWLRRLPLTRKATWWCCLTMTLLTVRWLSFHSMLV
ncbi:DUF5658 family protein [Allorhodopirellula solitaria]|uniref:Uncharacterized protein n=1 Tax=Allorhodopirellula solitaria TaxID=2527987 RepID=A0A5C5YEQ8_9BACT|nr:DUF5658 family protein [Allorhodopirellula solitaria]TWT74237.1 hypothetical protein CA85_11240 [Allorhodopirellula solitaria]